ncbi:carboxylesterase family protein [Nocardia sp. JMUB6875]|uniref:carboxylesterase/lipase family protein n=1 Tax=Nocardia sp. JMUB6875 TaxID=3158170 RepID=UPI0032E53920
MIGTGVAVAAALAVAGCASARNRTTFSDADLTVRTTKGSVLGSREQGLAVFRGIPFAQPPTGTLRFAAPVPHDPWSGVRDAQAFGPPPPQPALFGAKAASGGGSDEWLTVNVWSPNPRGRKLPVLVWIYGGGYISGSSAQDGYDGGNLAGQDIVVVSLNYRVGVEGFAQIEGAVANRGLLDQVAALQWIQDNIEEFGGDPGNVTVFGQSAGAGSIAMLLAMPTARGLFHRAIAESVPASLPSPALAADITATIASGIGVEPTAAALAAIDPQALADASATLAMSIGAHQDRWGYRTVVTGSPFGPVVDGDVLPRSPWRAVAEGAGREVDLIVGHTRDEYNFMIYQAGGPPAITQAQSDLALRLVPPVSDGPQAYRTANPQANPEDLFQLVCSDFLFRMPSLHLARAHAAAGGITRLYEFRYDKTPIGAAHANELPLVFGNFGGDLATQLYGKAPSARTRQLSKEMLTAWASFAAHGDPGWPAFDLDSQLTRLYDDGESSIGAYPEQASQRIWADYRFDPLPLLQP